ncbi:malto-oligosyltrehalose synthase [Citricoccus sp. NR2]|uniref:malto-oligosyltrehalose synthase n=1 Tax=Citricoccus sp. NR2 TaxID=3004095 RepID=UPI0022DDC3B7|nr:malto-oligosyltrehalose synthase [Citricoccus sp. NR2]WBL19139.1 malto-oligosyltrehalose synthase [Citricoccus sp. NR2]
MSTPLASPSPRSTYRLQISPSFTVDGALEVLPYLRDLGADWVYLSPMMASTSGSDHGYDVVDPTRVDEQRGGEGRLRRLAEAAHQAGMGVLLDAVPNHVGVADPRQNPWWWDVLREGQVSASAKMFDIDWAAGEGKVLLPVLGDGNETDSEAGLDQLRIEGETLRYYDHVFPLAEGSLDAGLTPREVHARQHYRLVPWRWADDRLNYRRFFAINELAAVRVEDPEVFAAVNAVTLRLLREGVVDGLRLDHVDGLADPGGYCARLHEATDGAHIVVEKILEPGEELPADWLVAGTTGYEALAVIDRVLTDPTGAEALDAAAGQRDPAREWAELTHHTRLTVARTQLGSEVNRLLRELGWADNVDVDARKEALNELLASLPVYRSYLPTGRASLEEAFAAVRARRPELAPVLDELHPILTDAEQPVARRFQQTSGAVMAKGVEDSAFYRYTRLSSLNEVGGDPSRFAVDLDEYHRAQSQRQAETPHAMTALSTHDTKRSEDVRARIAVLSECSADWATQLEQLHRAAPQYDRTFAKLFWETLLGVWPADGTAPDTERLADYAVKAAREAGTATTWTDPDDDVEQALIRAAEAATAGTGPVREILQHVSDRISEAGARNQLVMRFLHLVNPGAPDVYQGTETVFPTLVDPDNRRSVDFTSRASALRRLEEQPPTAWTLPDDVDDAKLLITARTLRLRRDHPALFTRYAPAEVVGAQADRVIASHRGEAVAVAGRWWLERYWDDTAVVLPEREFVDAFTGTRIDARQHRVAPVAQLLEHLPVALLIPASHTLTPKSQS